MKNKKSKNQQFAVIGLGRFGSTVAKTLFEKGEEVLAVDIKEEVITEAHEYTTHAVVADVTDERTLRALGIENFDVVIIGIASDLEASVLCALTCKEIGVKKVIAKAENLKHKMVLERVGADEVVIPEMEMGEKMGARLANPLLHDIMTISSKYSIIEMELPSSWAGSSLVTLDIRKNTTSTFLRSSATTTSSSTSPRTNLCLTAIRCLSAGAGRCSTCFKTNTIKTATIRAFSAFLQNPKTRVRSVH